MALTFIIPCNCSLPYTKDGCHVSTCRLIYWLALHARAWLRPLRAVCLLAFGHRYYAGRDGTGHRVVGDEWAGTPTGKNTLGLMPQALVTSDSGSINPRQTPAGSLHLSGVSRITPLTTGEVVMQSAGSVGVGVMLGIDPDEADPLTPFLINVKQQQLRSGQYNVIVGEQLAGQLGLKTGEQVRMMVPSASQFTPMGRIPSQRLFTVIGTFSANSDVDGYQVLVNQQDASRLMRYPAGNITGWRLWLDKPLQVDSTSQQALPESLVWKDWRERKGELFQAVKMEKNMMGLLLSLIVAVAAFNIVTSLGLLIMEKQGEVAILQTQGLTRRQIVALFMVQGATSGIVGSLLGALLGVLLASQLDNLMPVIGTFLEEGALPVEISLAQVATITVTAIIVALLSTLYPSWRAAAVQPAEALRYE
ncbi:Lipoprotein releasing system, transmembrane protein [Erwinia amylovora MR1]|nr:Lipoprotein releasing system, transmembrane protein [Erwinia amylovora MR1]